MRRGAAVAVAAWLIWCTASARGAEPQQVDAAIERGVAWLLDQQDKEGHWERGPEPDPQARPWQPAGGQWGGTTALAMWALLASGHSPQDPAISQAIEFVKTTEMSGVYALAVRAQVLQRLAPTPQVRALVARDAATLQRMMIPDGPGRGFFDYVGAGGRSYSHSRGNYGLLGLWASSQAGAEVSPQVWRDAEEGWIAHQHPGGGWTYKAPDETEHPVTAGMTAAGVASLLITQEMLAPQRGADCRPVEPNEPVERGLAWLVEHFDTVASDTAAPRDFPYATLLAVERVAMASGLRSFGEVDWYQHGADWLVRRQTSAGGWAESRRSGGDVVDTSFALLFLARGRLPVILAKLNHTEDPARPARWDSRPRDAANLARWAGAAMERELSWQIVPASAPQSILHESPILMVCGRDEFAPTAQLTDSLRAYVHSGGLILAIAECDGRSFATTFRRWAEETLGYQFRDLPADHPIYTHQQFARASWRSRPVVAGLSNGVRELVLLLPEGDPGRVWQMNQPRLQEHFWQLGADIIQYAVDQKALGQRGHTRLVARDPSVSSSRTIRIVRLRHAGNWDPEPAGWPRLAAIMHNQHRVALDVSDDPNALSSADPPRFAHLTGTDGLALDDTTRDAVRRWLDGGGTLIVDAAGGSAAFAASVGPIVQDLAGGDLSPLPADHAVYTSGSQPLGEVRFRRFARTQRGLRDGPPRLQAIERNGRLAVIFSAEDLSAGLVGQDVDGIVGYEPESAVAIMSRILLQAGD